MNEDFVKTHKPRTKHFRLALYFKIIIVFIFIIAAFICGIWITKWHAARNITNKIGLTEPQEITIEKPLEFDYETTTGENGEIIIIIKPK